MQSLKCALSVSAIGMVGLLLMGAELALIPLVILVSACTALRQRVIPRLVNVPSAASRSGADPDWYRSSLDSRR